MSGVSFKSWNCCNLRYFADESIREGSSTVTTLQVFLGLAFILPSAESLLLICCCFSIIPYFCLGLWGGGAFLFFFGSNPPLKLFVCLYSRRTGFNPDYRYRCRTEAQLIINHPPPGLHQSPDDPELMSACSVSVEGSDVFLLHCEP